MEPLQQHREEGPAEGETGPGALTRGAATREQAERGDGHEGERPQPVRGEGQCQPDSGRGGARRTRCLAPYEAAQPLHPAGAADDGRVIARFAVPVGGRVGDGVSDGGSGLVRIRARGALAGAVLLDRPRRAARARRLTGAFRWLGGRTAGGGCGCGVGTRWHGRALPPGRAVVRRPYNARVPPRAAGSQCQDGSRPGLGLFTRLRAVRTDAIPAPQQKSQRGREIPSNGEEKGEQRGKMHRSAGLRIGARRPSGRPGTRWLRVDRKPLSTERPGPTRVAPAGRPEPSLAPWRGRWTWLPVVVPRCGTPPHGPAAFDDCAESLPVGRPVVDPAEPTRPPGARLSTAALTCGVSPNQPGQCRGGSRRSRDGLSRPSSAARARAYVTRSAVRRPFVRPPPSADRPGVRRRGSGRAGRGCRSAGRSTSGRPGRRGPGRPVRRCARRA